MTFGKSVEPLVSHLIESMLPDMPEEAAELCRCLIESTGSRQKAIMQDFDELSQELH